MIVSFVMTGRENLRAVQVILHVVDNLRTIYVVLHQVLTQPTILTELWVMNFVPHARFNTVRAWV